MTIVVENNIDHKKILWLVELQYGLHSGLFDWNEDEISQMVEEGLIKMSPVGYVPTKPILQQQSTSTPKEIVVDEESVESWIGEYQKIFKAAKNGTMGSKSVCIKKMKRFMAENPEYTKDVILRATQLYIDECVQNDQYARHPQYFISKQEGDKITSSYLMDWCEIVLSGEYDEDEEDFLI